jgi:hypothetical protein
MNLIDRRTITDLAAATGTGPRVSIYLPTHRTGREIRQGPIRLKNLLRTAQDRLQDLEISPRDAGRMLDPAASLVNATSFWERQQDGLALFIGPEGMHEFRCPRRFDEFCHVHDHFHLKPLLPLLRNESVFYLLALSLNEVRLYEVTASDLVELDRGGIPASLVEALGHELDEPTLQHHAGSSPGRPGLESVYHGQGAGEDDQEQDVLRFLQRVQAGLHERLPEQDVPLVLVGVEELLTRFRKIYHGPSRLTDNVTGSPQGFTADQLREAAWTVARPVLEREADAAMARFIELSGTGRTLTHLQEIGPALAAGRVETLLVAVDRIIWGVMSDDGRLTVHREPRPGDVDLLDRLAMFGFTHGSEVIARRAARLPDGIGAAAVLRF